MQCPLPFPHFPPGFPMVNILQQFPRHQTAIFRNNVAKCSIIILLSIYTIQYIQAYVNYDYLAMTSCTGRMLFPMAPAGFKNHILIVLWSDDTLILYIISVYRNNIKYQSII